MVLKTLNTMTPIGFPGIIKPAKNGDRTLSATLFSIAYTRTHTHKRRKTARTQRNISDSENHASRDLLFKLEIISQ